MSESISNSRRALDLLAGLRSGEASLDEVRAFGEEAPDEFFRIIVESLSDSFDERDARIYERVMQAWIPERDRSLPRVPDNTDRVYVLSRVTLGADIKITSVVLDAVKRRYPGAAIVLVGSAKSAQLFAGDPRIEWMEANYPRSGSVAAKLEFLRNLKFEGGIVVDPDSRFTQLGLVVPCDPARYFHFPSRVYRAESELGLGALAGDWMLSTFGVHGEAYLPLHREPEAGSVAVSLGVGENPAKRIGGEFESEWLRQLSGKFKAIYVDRGAGGEERDRVDTAVQKAGVPVRFCEGSFADFVRVIARCEAYVGYDSAGQHAAAALAVPVTTIFAGAPNARFRARWQPEGTGAIRVIAADDVSPDKILAALC